MTGLKETYKDEKNIICGFFILLAQHLAAGNGMEARTRRVYLAGIQKRGMIAASAVITRVSSRLNRLEGPAHRKKRRVYTVYPWISKDD